MSKSDTLDPSRIRRVLVTKLRHHGDVLLASPVLGALKRHLPQAEIDALVYQDTGEMLSLHPALSQLHLVTKRGTLREELRLLQGLRSRCYDLLVHLTGSARGAWLARVLRPAVSVAPNYPGKLYRSSFTHLYLHANARHIVECNLDALRRIGFWPEESDKKLVLVAGADAERSGENHLRDLGLEAGKFILIHPTSRWQFMCWPEEKVAELAVRLAARGFPLLFTSAPDTQETGMIQRILARVPFPAPSLAGRLTLKELAALIARALVHRHGLGTHAHGGRCRHTGRRAVRSEWRNPLGPMAGASPGRYFGPLLPPLRPRQLRRQQTQRLPADHPDRPGTGRRSEITAAAAVKLANVRQRYTLFGGTARILEHAYGRLHQSHRAHEHGQPAA